MKTCFISTLLCLFSVCALFAADEMTIYAHASDEVVREFVAPKSIAIYTFWGQCVFRHNQTIDAGKPLPLPQLISGFYLLQATDADGRSYNTKIHIQ